MQKLTLSKFDNIIDNVSKELDNMKLQNVNYNNNDQQQFKIEDKEESTIQFNKNDSINSCLRRNMFSQSKINFPNKSEFENNEFNESKYDNIFNSKIVSYLNKSDNKSNKFSNISSITKDEFENENKSLLDYNFDYIKPKDWEYTNDNSIFIIENKIQQIQTKMNKNEINQLYSSIKKCDINVIYANNNAIYNILPLNFMENLVESNYNYDPNYKKEITEQILLLDNYIFKWRNINNDGNCFYRSIIFGLLENIILTDNIMLIKEFIILFDEKINLNNPNIKSNTLIQQTIEIIDKDLILQILYVIYLAMEYPENIGNPYQILIKSFNFCLPFDKGMIYFLKFLLYEFILENKNKIYNNEYPIKIGNLLSDKYINENGEYLFDYFFQDNLLKMDTDVEKIVIYLTPFIIKCDINILIYNFEKNEIPCQKLFKCGLNEKEKINLLLRFSHYDMIYYYDYYNKFKKQFDCYSYHNLIFRVVEFNYLEKIRNLKKSQETFEENNINKYPNLSKIIDNYNDNNNNNNYNYNNININYKNENNNNPNQNYNNNNNDRFNNNNFSQNNDNNQNYNNNNNDNNQNLCVICFNNINKNNSFKLCNDCLSSEIQTQMMGFYIDYLTSHTNNLNPKKLYEFNIMFDNYIKKKVCIIQNQKANLLNCIKLTGKSLTDYIKPIKKSICVQCQNNLEYNIQSYTLPCYCVLCSIKCINKYFNFLLINQIKLIKENKIRNNIFDCCYCGYQFNNNDYISLYKDFNKLKLKDYQKYLIEAIQNNWYQKCLICLKEFNINNKNDIFYKLELKDKKINEILELKTFKHIICSECFNKKNKEIQCNLCDSQHKIIIWKEYSYKDDEDCSIF